MANLGRHIENVRKFGVPPIVAINAFTSDTPAEFELIQNVCRDEFGAEAVLCTHWADGGKGAVELAEKVVAIAEGGKSVYKPLYELDMTIADKMRTVATEIYRAKDIAIEAKAKTAIKTFEDLGFRQPADLRLRRRNIRSAPMRRRSARRAITFCRSSTLALSAGAGFIVLTCGDIMTLPGLPVEPSAHKIGLGRQGPDRRAVLRNHQSLYCSRITPTKG